MVKVSHLPYYGGAKGHTLEITHTSDGEIHTKILQHEIKTEQPFPVDVEYPPLPSRYGEYDKHLRNIHQTALKIVQLQEQSKRQGLLSEDDKEQYQKNLDSLNLSAKNLVSLQDSAEDEDVIEGRETGLSSWFENKNTKKNKNKTDIKKEEDRKKIEEAKKKEELNKKKIIDNMKKEEEIKNESEEENKEETENTDNEETVAINLPDAEAAVAEAKPVGLAVAGSPQTAYLNFNLL